VETVVHETRPFRLGEEFGFEPDQGARRDHPFHPHSVVVVGVHVFDGETALAEIFHHDALVGFVPRPPTDIPPVPRLCRFRF
jgi:hypothetical protein